MSTTSRGAMFAVAGTAPRAPYSIAWKISVSRPISTLKRSGTARTNSWVICRSPEESALGQAVELAVGAEDEDAVSAAGEEAVDEPLEPRQVEVFVGLHRRGDGGDDALDTHGNPRKT